MTRLSGVLPDQRITTPRQRAIDRQREAMRPGAVRAVRDAINSEWVSSWGLRQFGRSGFEFDPDFALTEDLVKELGEGIPEELWPGFEDAVSLPHAQRIREQLADVAGSRDRLAALGWRGTALQVGAAIFDPTFIAGSIGAGAITGGTGTAASVAGRMGRLGRLIRGGIVAAASDIPIQAYLSDQDPQQGISDVLWTGAGSFVMGGAMDALVGGRLSRAAKRLRRDVEFEDSAIMAMGAASRREFSIEGQVEISEDARATLENFITREGRVYFKDQLADLDQQRIVERLIKLSGLDEDMDADAIAALRAAEPIEAVRRFVRPAEGELPPRNPSVRPPTEDEIAARTAQLLVDHPNLGEQAAREAAVRQLAHEDATRRGLPFPGRGGGEPPAGSAAAGDAPEPRPTKAAGDLTIHLSDDPAAMAGGRLRTFSSVLGSSPVPEVRQAVNAFAQSALLGQRGEPVPTGASAWRSRQMDARRARYYRSIDAAFREHARAEGIPFWRRIAAREKFAEAVGVARRLGPSYTSLAPDSPIAKALRSVDETIRDALELAKRHGVKGFDSIAHSSTYLPRIPNAGKINAAYRLHGDAAVNELFTEAIRRGRPDLDEEIARKIGPLFAAKWRGLGNRPLFQSRMMFEGAEPEELAAILRDLGMTEDLIEQALYAASPRDPQGNIIDRAKHRMVLDETYRHPMPDGSTLSIADLIENNVDAVVGAYVSDLVGASAATEVYRAMSRSLDPSGRLKIETFDQLATRLDQRMIAAGIDETTRRRDLDNLALLDRHVRGLALNPNTRLNRILRLLRAFNYIRLSGGFGIAQVPEFGGVVAEAGWRVQLQQMPALVSIFARAATGKLNDPLLDFLESFVGLGTDRINNQFIARMDHGAALQEFGGGRLERILHQGGRIASDWSGMSFVNMAMQRWAGLCAVQKFVNHAMSNRLPSAKRLAALGMNKADAEQVMKAIREEAAAGRGIVQETHWLSGRRVRDVRINEWADQQAASIFVDVIDRWSRRVVQDNDIGQMHPWMTKEGVKVITQFRTFNIVAWEKNLLHTVQMRDREAVTRVAYTSMLAAITHVLYHYGRSIGREDAAEYRAEKLSPEAITAAAVQRAGWASLLPGAIDSAWHVSGGDPIFTERMTGLSSTFGPASNPTTDLLVNQAPRAVRGVGLALRGKDPFTRDDLEAFTQLVPFSRAFGMRRLLEAMAKQAPEE